MIDLSDMDIFTRMEWAAENLKPVHSEYRVLYEDPLNPDAPVCVLNPTGEWMACALNGGILPSIEHYHNTKLLLRTSDGEEIETTQFNSYDIKSEKMIVEESIVNYNQYVMAKPIGPMTEEQAIEYLIMKDVPPRVWHSEYKYNRQMFKIVKQDQIPKNRTYRDCWRLS